MFIEQNINFRQIDISFRKPINCDESFRLWVIAPIEEMKFRGKVDNGETILQLGTGIFIVKLIFWLVAWRHQFWKAHFRKFGSSCSKTMQKSCTQGGTSDYVIVLDYSFIWQIQVVQPWPREQKMIGLNAYNRGRYFNPYLNRKKD